MRFQTITLYILRLLAIMHLTGMVVLKLLRVSPIFPLSIRKTQMVVGFILGYTGRYLKACAVTGGYRAKL